MAELWIGLAQSLAGFIVGFVLGRLTRRATTTKENAVPRTFADEHLHPTKLGVIIIILSVVTVVMAGFTSIKATQTARCQTAYNARFFEAYTARAKAANSDREALNTMLERIGDPKISPAQRKAAFVGYLDNVKKTDEQRRRNPLPEPPDPRAYCT